MLQKKVTELVASITELAIEVTSQNKAIVFVDYSGHVHMFYVKIYAAGTKFERGVDRQSVYTKEVQLFNEFKIVDDAKFEEQTLGVLYDMQDTLIKYLKGCRFDHVWNEFKGLVETDIVKSSDVTSSQHFYDVYKKTEGHEISLDCVYQGLKLTQGPQLAELFKAEMLNNIEQLQRLVALNWSEYEKEVV